MAASPQLPKLGASACVWRDGRVLLIQRAKPPVGLWSLPGGHVDFGETALAAATRELFEETGVVAQLSEFVGLYEIIRKEPPIHYAIACYCGPWRSGEAAASGDALTVRWLAPSEFDGLEFVPNIRAAVARSQVLLKM